MPDAHDGPISQGIRDAIKASDKTPYAIAKEVTQGERVKLTGPQIYRFLNNQKGLSLAVLDEIARVLDVVVRLRSAEISHAKETTPPQARRSRRSPHREIFQERLDRMAAIAAAEDKNLDEKITLLDQAYNSIYRESLWMPGEVSILFDHLNTLKSDVRNPPPLDPVTPVTVVNGIELTGDESLEDINYIFQYDQKKVKEYLAALRRSRLYERKPPNLELSRRRRLRRGPMDTPYPYLGVCRPSSTSDSSATSSDESDGELEDDELEDDELEDDDDEDSWNPQEPDSSFQAKLDSLRLPDGFEEGETSWQPKAKRLEARYKSLLVEIGSSPRKKQLVDARYKQELGRIIKESEDTPEHEWFG